MCEWHITAAAKVLAAVISTERATFALQYGHWFI